MDPSPRFSWPMRLFLSVIVFDICFRSMTVVVPIHEWYRELDMHPWPTPLPTNEEWRERREKGTLSTRLWQSADSLWAYAKPWPDPRTRDKIDSFPRAARFAVCWLNSRFEFAENVLGVDQSWPMFSPNVSRGRSLARCQLVYADGSRKIVRLTADPPDLTNYSHWFQEKVLDHELRIVHDRTATVGHCNLLSHRYAVNESGSPLETIYVFSVAYDYTPPGEDATEYLRAQSGPPLERMSMPFFRYDVTAKKGYDLDDCSQSWIAVQGLPIADAPFNAVLGTLLFGDLPKQMHQLDS